MFVTKLFASFAATLLISSFAVFDILAQKQTSKSTKPLVSKAKIKKKTSVPRTISFGIFNGKAIFLVKPKYPPTALATNVKGNVQIQVLIDEKGKVIEARSLRGHPFLIPASLKAARASTFEPILLSGQPVRVNGVIVYKYLYDSMNWLELSFSADSVETLIRYLPTGFEAERDFLKSLESSSDDEKIGVAWDMIFGKLSFDEKARWLIALGRQLATLSRFHWDAGRKNEVFNEIKVLLATCPENISTNLKSLLNNLIDPERQLRLNDNLLDLSDKLYSLGK